MDILLIMLGVGGTLFVMGLVIGLLLRRVQPIEESPPSIAESGQPVQGLGEVAQCVRQFDEVNDCLASDLQEHSLSIQKIVQQLHEISVEGESAATETVRAAGSRLGQVHAQLDEQLGLVQAMIETVSQRVEKQLTHSLTDSLTGLANRLALDQEISRQLAFSQQHHRPCSLLMIDVDHFKQLNDTCGHQMGDEVLRSVARLLTETMRQSDLVARYGGEEFAIVLPETDPAAARQVGDRARRAIREKNKCDDGRPWKVTVSVGVATWYSGEDAVSLLRRADQALYGAKGGGRDISYWHDGQTIVPIVDG